MVVSTTAILAIFAVGLLTVIATSAAKALDHLGHIRRMLGQLLDERMDPDATADRLHRAATGAIESARHLKLIEQRIEPLTQSRFERRMDELIQRIESRSNGEPSDE
jgi:hypothetical protein